MTDTPPFYWLNGEDGPLEADDETHQEHHQDGVLAVPGKSKNGLLGKIDLSRTLDRQRRSGAGPGPGAATSFDGIAARGRKSVPTAPPVPVSRAHSSHAVARSHSSSTQPRRTRAAPREDEHSFGVDVSGMPGGGLRPPTPLRVPGLRSVLPPSREGMPPFSQPGAAVHPGLVAGMCAKSPASSAGMVGAGSVPPGAVPAAWPLHTNLAVAAPSPSGVSRHGAQGMPQASNPAVLGVSPGLVGSLKVSAPTCGAADMQMAALRPLQACAPVAAGSLQLAQCNAAVARHPSTPPLPGPLRAGQGAAGTSWHWSEASQLMPPGTSQLTPPGIGALSTTRAPEPTRFPPGRGSLRLNLGELARLPAGSANSSVCPDMPYMSGKSEELPTTLGAGSSRCQQGLSMSSRSISPTLWPRNTTPPASPGSWKRGVEVGKWVPGSSFPYASAHSEQSTSAAGSVSYPSACISAPGSVSYPSVGEGWSLAPAPVQIRPYSSISGVPGLGPPVAAPTMTPASLTPSVDPGASYIPTMSVGSSLLSPSRVRPGERSPQRSQAMEAGMPLVGLMQPSVFPHEPMQAMTQTAVDAAECAFLPAQLIGLAASEQPSHSALPFPMTSLSLPADAIAASTLMAGSDEQYSGSQLRPADYIDYRPVNTPSWAQPNSPECLSPEWHGAQCVEPQVAGAVAERPRVLVTGATGLLGRQVMQALDDLEVRGLCRSRGNPPMVCCDLTMEGVAAKEIEEFRPHIVIHLAGERCPDVLRRSPARARLLNVDASGAVAAACECVGSWLIMMSADAVFDGSSPPYATDDSPNPLSEYGWHKLHAEKLVLAACPGAAVLRVPMLYGGVEFAAESVVTGIFAELRTGATHVDNWQRCYPTWAPDVARVLRALVDTHLAGVDLRGIFHWQGDECFTRYEMACVMAEISGLSAPEASVEKWSWAPIPEDIRLDCSRLEELLSNPMTGLRRYRTSLREGLGVCLAPFLDACRSFDLCQQASMPSNRTAQAEAHHRSNDTKCSSDQILCDSEGGQTGLHEANLATLDAEEGVENDAPSSGATPGFTAGASNTRYEELMNKLSYGLRDTPAFARRKGGAPLTSQQSPSAEMNSALWEEQPEARSSALKAVFREELEHAWRRYRDAAHEGREAKIKSTYAKQS